MDVYLFYLLAFCCFTKRIAETERIIHCYDDDFDDQDDDDDDERKKQNFIYLENSSCFFSCFMFAPSQSKSKQNTFDSISRPVHIHTNAGIVVCQEFDDHDNDTNARSVFYLSSFCFREVEVFNTLNEWGRERLWVVMYVLKLYDRAIHWDFQSE